jgi:hypothetical protein
MLDTACRPGEILSLQWVDVSLTRCELTIRAENEKTRRERIIPISTRLFAILEMRKHDPAGRMFGPDAYVFGDSLGRRVKSVQGAWVNAAAKAGLKDFQLRDLRHHAERRIMPRRVPDDRFSGGSREARRWCIGIITTVRERPGVGRSDGNAEAWRPAAWCETELVPSNEDRHAGTFGWFRPTRGQAIGQ